jgi:tryptophan 7-halogenase
MMSDCGIEPGSKRRISPGLGGIDHFIAADDAIRTHPKNGGRLSTRVAVVGGGTAGFMAAAHLSRHFTDLELVQVLDPRIPTIGVGEGTTPGFRSWLDAVTGVSYEDLRRELRVTPKLGIRFENWGRAHRVFNHDFVPLSGMGLHLSATQLVSFLRRYVRGELIEAHVEGIDGGVEGAVVRLEGGGRIAVDVAVDARGFPRVLTDEHVQLSWVPTDTALVTRTPRVSSGLAHTRAVARPHGWVFVIPLTGDTAYGYIYGSEYSSRDDVEADFAALLASEGIVDYAAPRVIRFPNFACKVPFNGRVLKFGNAASFIEPLEATAIAIARYEITFLGAWLRAFEAAPRGRIADALVADLNRRIVELVLEVSLFIGWHYVEGSAFDTEFWRGARRRFRQGLDQLVPPGMRARFQEQVAHASRIRTADIAGVKSPADLDRLFPAHRSFPPPFGGFTPLGFAQVAEGIGYTRPAAG